MASSNIPEKTIERLSEYRRTLLSCHKQGITHIFSHVLAGIHGITAVQVRRDLMLIGFSSDTKKGYDVKVLIDFISNILDSDTVTNIAVIGMGHLGQAITKYFNGRGLKLKITTAFDIDPAKVGQTIDGIPCHHMETFEEVVEDKDIEHRHRLVSLARSRRTGRPDRQRRHQGRAQLHLAAAQLPARHRGRELRHHHAARKGRLFRQGKRRKQQQQRMMQREAKNAAEGGKTGSHDIHGDLAEHRPVAGRPDMRVFYGFDALPHFVRPTVTVGSYDGVHSGHLALLRTVAGRARAQGGESVVLTFEPHPRVTLGRADGLRLLTSLEEKIYLLGQQGIDNLIVIPFDKAFSALAPDTFIRDYLVGRIGAETLVVGFNHRFGRDKQGSYDYLGSHGFGLEVVEVGECDVDAEKVSSTVIRRLVAQGDMARAARLLSHPYLVIGTAAAGRIRTDDPLKLLPPAGSYQVRIGGRPARLTVDTSQNLIIRDGCPDGRAVLTF